MCKYPFDSDEDPNGQDVCHNAQEPGEGGPDAHHGEQVHRGRGHGHQVQRVRAGVYIHVRVTHVACKLDMINLLDSNRLDPRVRLDLCVRLCVN